MRKRFVVPGRPVGYTATTFRGKWAPAFVKYGDYCKFVRKCAIRAGIRLPLVATEEKPLIIKTIAYFPNRVHCDPGNVNKGVADALFYDAEGVIMRKIAKGKKRSKKGDDKYVGGSFPPPKYCKEDPRVIVIIKDYSSESEKSK